MYSIDGNDALGTSSKLGVKDYQRKYHNDVGSISRSKCDIVERHILSQDKTIYHDKESFGSSDSVDPNKKQVDKDTICFSGPSKRELETVIYNRLKDKKKGKGKAVGVIVVILLIAIGFTIVWFMFIKKGKRLKIDIHGDKKIKYEGGYYRRMGYTNHEQSELNIPGQC